MIATAIERHSRRAVSAASSSFSAYPVSSYRDEFGKLLGMEETASGEAVTEYGALGIPAFFSGVCIIAETLSWFEMKYHERVDGRTSELTKDPLWQIVYDAPNDYMTRDIWDLITAMRMILWGNAYDQRERTRRGDTVACHPIHPSCVEVELWTSRSRPNDPPRLLYHIQHEPDPLDQEDVIHCRGPGDHLMGWSVIRLQREMLGSTLALQKHTAKFWKNGAKMSGVLTHDAFLKKDKDAGAKRIEQQFTEKVKQGLTPMLEGGVKFIPTSVPHDDAQYLGTWDMSVLQAAQALRMPPVMLGLRDASYNNEEMLALRFYKHTMQPYMTWIERQRSRKLIPRELQDRRFFRYHSGELLRSDAKSRAEVDHIYRQDGVLNGDEIRENIDRNPMPDGQGEIYLFPENMKPAESATALAARVRAKGDNEADVEFLRDVVKKFLEDKTTNDVFYNLTEVKELLRRVGVPMEPGYLPPWAPVVAETGPLVSGEVIRDSEKDIVGGDVLPPAEPEEPAQAGNGEAKENEGEDANGRGEAHGPIVSPMAERAESVIQGLFGYAANQVVRLTSSKLQALEKRGEPLADFLSEHEVWVMSAVAPSVDAGFALRGKVNDPQAAARAASAYCQWVGSFEGKRGKLIEQQGAGKLTAILAEVLS